MFGGLWQPSLLGYAIEQYLRQRRPRGTHRARRQWRTGCDLTLKAGGQALELQALRPGTREFLRASVDFDNVGPDEAAVFNLTVQRVRAQGTGQVEDQEIFHRLSVTPSDARYLPSAISQSALVRLVGERALAAPG